MLDNEEMLGDFSYEESETIESRDEEDAGAYFVFNGDFAPYQGEPLASSGDDMEDNLHFSIVRCQCGNCNVDHLVGACEYRCCLEVNKVKGKFMFVGAECVLNHPDFSALTNRTVLEQVGPFLQGKDGRRYRRRNDTNAAQNKRVIY